MYVVQTTPEVKPITTSEKSQSLQDTVTTARRNFQLHMNTLLEQSSLHFTTEHNNIVQKRKEKTKTKMKNDIREEVEAIRHLCIRWRTWKKS